MIKLVRNRLAARKQIVSHQLRVISWRYFEYLVKYQSGPNIQIHKLNKAHIEWEKNKMNVKIAAQTLSDTTANAMETLYEEKDYLFISCKETIRFIRNFNKIFDIFNAKHENSQNRNKRGLNVENAQEIFDFLNYMIIYIKSLTIRRVEVLKTKRATGFLGFLINIESLKILYEEIIVTKKLRVILFYYLGQDLLESLFSHVRGFLGGNDNPSATQLVGSVRKILVQNEFKASDGANCEDHLNLLYVSTASNRNSDRVDNKIVPRKISLEIDFQDVDKELLEFSELVTIKLRAGAIENRLKFTCTHCSHIFLNTQKIDGSYPSNMNRPCKSTVTICEIAYMILSKYLSDNNHEDLYFFKYDIVLRHILNFVPTDELFVGFYFSHNVEHKGQMIINIVDEYIKLHNTHLARRSTIANQTVYLGKVAKKYKHNVGQ